MKTKRRPLEFDSACERVRQTLCEHGMLEGAARVLLALSGGKDSVCLFHILRRILPELGGTLLCAHVNHGLRKRTAVRDARFCEKLCAEYGVPFFSFSCDVRAFQAQSGLSLEEAARTLRYRTLLDCAKKEHAVLATAHTVSDQAESVLMQISRGGGVRSACGISPVRKDGVIRPLLSLDTQDVLDVCKSEGFSFVTDETNRDTRFLRNFYRHRILKTMKRENPSVERCLARFALLQSQEHAAFVSLAHGKMTSLGFDLSAPRAPLRPLQTLLEDAAQKPLLYELLSAMLSAAGALKPLNSSAFERVFKHLRAPSACGTFVETGEGFGFLWESESLFATADQPHGSEKTPLSFGEASFSEHVFSLAEESVTEAQTKVYKFHTSTALDCDKIVGKLFLRLYAPGDEYTVNGRTRKVKELFNMRRIALGMRADYPLVCDEKGIVWIPGELAADRACAEESRKAVRVSLIGGPVYEELLKRRQYE